VIQLKEDQKVTLVDSYSLLISDEINQSVMNRMAYCNQSQIIRVTMESDPQVSLRILTRGGTLGSVGIP